jgi:hypothetical protein
MILAKNAVKVDEGATIEGRLLSLNNKVSAPQSAMSPQQFGTLQICKTLTQGNPNAGSLLGRVFQFTVTGVAGTVTIGPFTTIGQTICTGALNVPAGPATITELNQTTNAAGGNLTTGGFQLFRVGVISPAVPAGTTGSTIGVVNLPARTIGVNIVAGGGIAGQLSLLLTNRAAITGFIEICKNAVTVVGTADPDVTGFFDFTIEGVFAQPGGTQLQVFTVPVGQCTNAIALVVGDPAQTQQLAALAENVEDLNADPISEEVNTSTKLLPNMTIATILKGSIFPLLFDPSVTATSLALGQEAENSKGNSTAGVTSPTAIAPSLGTAASFAVLAGSTVTNTGPSIVSGNLGVSPGSAVTGFPPGMVVNGVINAGNAVAAQAQSDLTVAFNNLAGQACDRNLTGQDLGGLTLTAGVNCFDTSAFLTGTLTLDAQGDPNAVFIFKIGSTLITASNSSVVVINGGTGCNVFFQVGSSAILGTGTSFTGNILALTSITLNTGANINAGRALARNGAVTLDTNNVSNQQCTNPPPTPTPTPATPTPTPTATPTPLPPTTVVIRELPRPGFIFTGATSVPGDRLINVDVPNRAVTIRVVEGGAANETIVNFINRAAPGLVKVCKIAGPGVAIGTQFVFQVEGTSGATAANAAAPGGFNFGNVVRAVVVPAGDPATGGNCVFVPGIGGTGDAAGLQTFLSGTPIRVFELGAVASPAGTTTVGATATGGTATTVGTAAPNGAGATTVNLVTTLIGGEAIRVARIRTSSTFTSTDLATFSPNPRLTPGTRAAAAGPPALPAITFLGAGSVFAQAGVTEIEFVDVGFSPATLKVCKIAGTNFPLNTAVTFDVAVVSPNTTGGVPGGTTPIFSAFTVPVTVNAGPAAQGGNCTFVDPTVGGTGTLLGGAFDIGSTVTITERGTSVVQSITSSTSTTVAAGAATGGLSVNLGTRAATLFGTGGLVAGVNIVTFTNSTTVGPPGDVKPAAFDFDGDGRSDTSVFRASNSVWYVMGSQSGLMAQQFGSSATDKLVPADYDGDSKTDFAVFRNGNWYIQRSNLGFTGMQFGEATDIPVPADYDGDGKADVAVFRPSNGTWYIYGSKDGYTNVQFGQAGDNPVAADYDGDGKADVAVFRPATGFWYRINSSTKQWSSIQFGMEGDKPVVADYDGDGKADIAVYRNGTWYAMKSKDGFAAFQFGIATDIPAAADYDGDGKADMSVYRGGIWHIQQSRDGYTSVNFGASTDMPIPASMLR